MRKFLNILALVLVFSLQANHIGRMNEVKDFQPLCLIQTGVNLNAIMNDILNNRGSYYIEGTMTVLADDVSGYTSSHLAVSIERTRISFRRGTDYIQANTQATYHSLTREREDEIRIYVHRDTNASNKKDLKSLKLNWKTGSRELVRVLSTLSAYYEPNGMLITGAFKDGSKVVGVSLAIT